jgi:hypothetical protein
MTDSAEDFSQTGAQGDINLTPLDDDCRLLASILDQSLKLEVGDVLFHKVRAKAGERAGGAARWARGGPGDAPGGGQAQMRHWAQEPSNAHAAAQVEKIRALANCAATLAQKGDAVRGGALF